MGVLTHTVRLTMRFHLGDYRKEADLSIPTTSSINEALPEITDLVGAPILTTPWQVSTSAGRPVEQDIPLAETGLRDGAVIVLTPAEDDPAPVVRDCAEALVETRSHLAARGMVTGWALVGVAAACVAIYLLVPPGWGSVAPAIGGLSGLTLSAYHREMTAAAWVGIIGLGAAGWAAVASGARAPWQPLATLLADALLPANPLTVTYGLVALAGMLSAAILLCHLTARCGARTTAAGITLAIAAITYGLGWLLPGPTGTLASVADGTGTLAGAGGAIDSFSPARASAAAGLVLAIALVGLSAAPGISIRAAGLRVPQLPTAGQDLAISDAVTTDVDNKSRRAQELYEGMCIGMAIALVPAFFSLALTGTGLLTELGPVFGYNQRGGLTVTVVALTTALAVVMHAARHSQPRAAWALMFIAMCAVITATVNAAVSWQAAPAASWVSWAQWVGPVIAVGTAVTSPWWAPKVSLVEPTTMQWWERAEAVAIALSLPLAIHVTGTFLLIRGLG